jgi:hypothetical protein
VSDWHILSYYLPLILTKAAVSKNDYPKYHDRKFTRDSPIEKLLEIQNRMRVVDVSKLDVKEFVKQFREEEDSKKLLLSTSDRISRIFENITKNRARWRDAATKNKEKA